MFVRASFAILCWIIQCLLCTLRSKMIFGGWVSQLEYSFSCGEVDFFFVAWVGWRQYCFVNVVNEAVLGEWAFCFICTVAGSLFSDGLGITNFVIVWINNCFRIWHTAMACLYSISVKYFVEPFVQWKIHI